MLLGTILLLYLFPQAGDVTNTAVDRPAAASANAIKDSPPQQALPSAPKPRIKTDTEIPSNTNPALALSTAPVAESILPGKPPIALKQGKPFFRPYETQRQNRVWYALTFASSGAAVFDAWSARRAISRGHATEANPFLRPFAHSGALYAATQASPVLMDFLGRRMMTSRHRWMRRIWWLPQTAGTGVSLAAGAHNVGIGPRFAEPKK